MKYCKHCRNKRKKLDNEGFCSSQCYFAYHAEKDTEIAVRNIRKLVQKIKKENS